MNQVWSQLLEHNAVGRFRETSGYESKMAVVLCAMLSDPNVSQTVHLMFQDPLKSRMADLLHAKAVETLKCKQPEQALSYLQHRGR